MADAETVSFSTFTAIKVPGKENNKISIKKFVESKGIEFKIGNGFYQLSKPEIIQFNKTILVQRISAPATLISGTATIRSVLKIDDSAVKKNSKFMVSDEILKEFKIFVQSTSYNRNLIGGTVFLHRKNDGDDPAMVTSTSGAGAVTDDDDAPAPKRSRPTRGTKDSTASAPVSSAPAARAGRATKAPTPAVSSPLAARASRATKAPAPAVSSVPVSRAGRATKASTPAVSSPPAPRATRPTKTSTPAVSAPAPPTTAPPARAPSSAPATISDKVEIVISFDTTGSMYPCLSTVRSVIRDTLNKLTSRIPSIRIGIIAHGDYCDAGSTYVTKAANNFKLCGSRDVSQLIDFVTNVSSTGGGDFPECYELVLREVRTKFDWSPGSNKSLIMIGDAPPHGVSENPGRIDWRVEARGLKDSGIRVYAVQALDYAQSDPFYREVAQITLGFHLRLYQFSSITDFLVAVCYHEGDNSQSTNNLNDFEAELSSTGRMVTNLRRLFDQLQGKAPSIAAVGAGVGAVSSSSCCSSELVPVSPSRFQVLTIDKDQAIKEFAQSRGLIFKVGRGFYEFTRPESISDKKEIVLMDKEKEDFYTGWVASRELSGIEPGKTTKQKPQGSDKYIVFVQSTSYNRKLIKGQRFLYEVDGDS